MQDKSVETLVVTNNMLTEECCTVLLLREKEKAKRLNNVYLGRNVNLRAKVKGDLLEQLQLRYNIFL